MNARRYLILLLPCLLLACAGSPPPQRYVLEPVAPAATPVPVAVPTAIALARIPLPAYLKYPEVIRRKGNRVIIEPGQLWAEPLLQAVPRVLQVNLATRLPGASLLQPPLTAGQKPDWKLVLQVQRLEAVEEAGRDVPEVQLDATWSVVDRKGKTVMNRQANLVEPAAASTTSALVSAHSRALAQLATQIAEDLRKLPAP